MNIETSLEPPLDLHPTPPAPSHDPEPNDPHTTTTTSSTSSSNSDDSSSSSSEDNDDSSGETPSNTTAASGSSPRLIATSSSAAAKTLKRNCPELPPETPKPNPAAGMILVTPPILPLISQVEQKWNRPLQQTPLVTDFPRMFSRISIQENGKEIWKPVIEVEEKNRRSKEKSMKEFLSILSERLKEDEVKSRLENSFDIHLPEGTTDTGGLLGTCVQSIFSNLIGENNSVTKLIKFINQGIVVPAVTILRLLFMKMKIAYKDCRGQWDVSLNFKNEEDKIVITHKKWEETIPVKFEFCWHLQIELGRDCKVIENVRLFIQTIKFVNTPTHEEENNLYSVLNDLYVPESSCK